MKSFAFIIFLASFTVGCGETFSVSDDIGPGGSKGSGSSFSASGGADASSGGSTGSASATGGVSTGGSATGSTSGSGGTLATGGDSTTGGAASTGGVSSGGTGGAVVTECTPGDGRCDGYNLQTCNASGFWATTQACPFACYHDEANNVCTGVCTPGATQCSLTGDVETCNSVGQWEYMAGWNCQYGCSAGACTGAYACTPNSKQCAGSTPQTCKSDGSAWVSASACPYVCSAGACTGVCTPGATDCSGNTPRTCNSSGQWISGSACPFSCSAGACVGSCTPGTSKCTGTGTQTCQGDYTWGTVAACPAGVHETPSCTGAGVCGKACNGGFANCNGGVDGCEADLSTTASCGSCGAVCTTPANAVPICSNSSSCSFVCNAGWADLNNNPSDGCEGDVYSDPENCGSKGHSCGGSACSSGSCAYPVSVLVSFKDSSQIHSYTVFGDYVYYSINNTNTGLYEIYKIGIDGTGNTLLFTMVKIPTAMVFGGNYLLVQSNYSYTNQAIYTSLYNMSTGAVITNGVSAAQGGVPPVYGNGYFYLAAGGGGGFDANQAKYPQLNGRIYQYDPVTNTVTTVLNQVYNSYTSTWNWSTTTVDSMQFVNGRLYYATSNWSYGVYPQTSRVDYLGEPVQTNVYVLLCQKVDCNFAISPDYAKYYTTPSNNLVVGATNTQNAETAITADSTSAGPMHLGANYILNVGPSASTYERSINGGPGTVIFKTDANHYTPMIYEAGYGFSLSRFKTTKALVLLVVTTSNVTPNVRSLVRITTSE